MKRPRTELEAPGGRGEPRPGSSGTVTLWANEKQIGDTGTVKQVVFDLKPSRHESEGAA